MSIAFVMNIIIHIFYIEKALFRHFLLLNAIYMIYRQAILLGFGGLGYYKIANLILIPLIINYYY